MNKNLQNKSQDYDNFGPRPPVPGQEDTTKYKMTDSAQAELHFLMTSSSSSSSSSPSCLKWARNLNCLLEDRDGVEQFKKYVEQEGGISSDRLNFYFACEGLKQQSDNEKIKQIIGAIYRFLKKSQLQIPDDIRQIVKSGIKDKDFIFTPDFFDQMQHDVVKIINETTYPNFLQSEMYLNYVQNYQSAIESRSFPPTTNTTTYTSSSATESNSRFLSRSATLPTLHEEGDAAIFEGTETLGCGSVGGFAEPRVPTAISSKVNFTLTKQALMATEQRRLEMRPSGAPGYNTAYNAYNSYNPVSRRDSELASLSSGRTDSDTMSISSMSTDGRPQRRQFHHHGHKHLERKMMRDNAAANNDIGSLAIIPRTQRIDPKTQVLSQEAFLNELIPRLEKIAKEQAQRKLLEDKLREGEQGGKMGGKILADAISAKLILGDDNTDQDILDQHVSRVWSDLTPLRSPGNLSPCTQQLQKKKNPELNPAIAGGCNSSIRAPKSMPESNMRKFSKWGSVNTDSGISLFSSDTMTYKQKDQMSISGSSNSSSTKPSRIPENIVSGTHTKMAAQSTDDIRRSKRYMQQPPLPHKNLVPPPLPAKNFQLPQPPQPATLQAQTAPEHTTTVVYSFCDEDVPYRIKIPGKNPPTLKQFKDYLPKKGNYRFYFKTRCDDDDNPIIQEEISHDAEVLPLFEGKVMATVKPIN